MPVLISAACQGGYVAAHSLPEDAFPARRRVRCTLLRQDSLVVEAVCGVWVGSGPMVRVTETSTEGLQTKHTDATRHGGINTR